MKRFLLIIGVVIVVWLLFASTKVKDKVYKDFLEPLTEAITLIDDYYIKSEDLDYKELRYQVMDALIKFLKDPHSSFLRPEEFKDVEEKTKGEFGGLGIILTQKEGKLIIISPMEDTPAHKAGIKPQDIITHINGEPTEGMTLKEAVSKLRGPKGTTVTITIKREDQEPFDLTLTRDIIEIVPVKWAKLNNQIGYIKITELSHKTGKYLNKALSFFKEQKIKGLIIDLRNCSGGLLDVSVETASKFLPKDAIVVRIEGKSPTKKVYKATNNYFYDFDLVLLINEGTASGAEIIAGALADNNRAYLIGQKTFGKSSVQTVLELSDRSAISLTTAYYYTPSGRLIHNQGIQPHKVVSPTKFDKETERLLDELKRQEFFKSFIKKLAKVGMDENKISVFIEKIKSQGYEIDEKILMWFIKREYIQEKEGILPLYDLEGDRQLQEAFHYFVKKYSEEKL